MPTQDVQRKGYSHSEVVIAIEEGVVEYRCTSCDAFAASLKKLAQIRCDSIQVVNRGGEI